MTKILNLIEEQKQRLDRNPLSDKLSNPAIPVANKMQCIPRLIFFVLGFKDCMKLLHKAKPTNEAEKIVNTHSEEDQFHWQWFLQDLEKLNIGNIQNQTTTSTLSNLWSDELMPVRQMVYTTTRYIQTLHNPILQLILIEVIESGYEAFTKYMSPVIQQAGMYDDLQYFGNVHNEAEADHDWNASDEQQALEKFIQQLSAGEKQVATQMVEDMYAHLNAMHNCFANSIQIN